MLIKAPVLHEVNRPQVIESVEVDEPRESEVLVRVVASGVCHSCLSSARGDWEGTRVPGILGDEGSGIVERVGSGVTTVRPGDHIILSWAPYCGRCHYCALGKPVLCNAFASKVWTATDGTCRFHLPDGRDVHHYAVTSYAPHTIIHESMAIKIDREIPLEKAALFGCSVMTGAGSVLNTAGVRPGESLVVFGCGGVGLNAVQGGRLVSANPLIAVDVADNKLEFARRMGATDLVNAAREDAPAVVKSLTAARGYPGVDHAVVCVGSTAAVEQALHCLAPGGRCVVVGGPPSHERLTGESLGLLGGERQLTRSVYGSNRPNVDFPRLVELYRAGKLMIDELVTRTYSIDQAEQAFDDLAAGVLARGIIVHG
jgi:S-(hydroxymethyl)glutathione dehydrogenase/alcohol dehydrogenase